MRLNPFAPKDDPMYESLFCFGGPSDSGGSDASGDPSEESTVDFGGGPGFDDGDTGDTGGSSNVGGSPDDQDSMDSGYDTSTVGMGTNTMGGGGGGSRFYADPVGSPKYPDVSDFGKKQTEAEAAAAKAGVPSNVFVTNNGNIVRSRDGTPVTSSRSVEAAAKAAGTDTSSIMDAIRGAAGTDFGEGFGVAPGPGTPGQGTAITKEAGVEQARQANITGKVFQTPYQQSVTTPQQRMEKAYIDAAVRGFRTDQPFGLADRSVIGMMTPMEAAQNSFMNDISVFAPETIDPTRPDLALDPSRPAVSIRGATPAEQITAEARAAANQLFGPGRTPPTAAEVAAANERLTARTPGLQEAIAGGIMPANIEGQYGMQPTTTEVDAYNQAINEQIADQLGITSYDPATFGATGPISQVSTAPISQQDYTNLQAGRGVIQGGIAGVNQMVDQAMKEVELETGVPASQMQGIIASNIGSSGGMSTRPSTTPGQGILSVDGVDYTFDNTVPADQRTYTQATPSQVTANNQLMGASGAATELLGGYDRAMAEQRAVANRDQMAAEMAAEMALTGSPTFDARVTEQATQAAAPDKYTGEVVPGMGVSIDRAIDDFVGQRIGRTQEMGPDGKVTTENFGLRGDLVSQPTPYLSGYSPTQQNMMEEGYLAERNVDIPFLPAASGVINTFFNPEYMVTDAIRNGATPIYSQDGTQIIGARSENGEVVYSETPFGDIYSGLTGELDPNMQAAYDERRRIEEQQQEMQGGDGGGQMLPPVEKVPEEVPEEYQGREVIKPYQYQPRGPLTYAYTGLPSLAPTRLRPSYSAPKKFSPLFPVS